MGKSYHRRAADALADSWVRESDGRVRLANAFLMTRDPDIEMRSIISIIGQPHGGWEMGQLFALFCVVNLWHNDALSAVNLRVSATPSKDAERLVNQKKLDELQSPFRATVDTDQRGAEGDGTLTWEAEVDGYVSGSAEPVKIAAGSAPLEIGSTDASMTLFHLARFGAVARYPYEASTVVLLSCNPRDLIARWRADVLGRPEGEPPTLTGGRFPVVDDLVEFTDLLAGTRLFGRSVIEQFDDGQFEPGGI